MTIQSMSNFVASLWDWGFLDDCFGNTGIRISDLDGVVERNDWKLCIEGKGPNVEIKNGQWRLFRSLVKDGWTIIVVWGNANEPERMMVWYPRKERPEATKEASLEDIKDLVRRWFNWANANGNVS